MPNPAPQAQNNDDWMADLMVSAPAAAPAAPAAPGPGAQPFPPFPQAPQPARLAPDDLDYIVRGVSEQQAAQRQAPAPAAAPAAQPAAPAALFQPGEVEFTPEERERLRSSGAEDLLQKVARSAVAHYDSTVGRRNREDIERLRAEQTAATQQTQAERERTSTEMVRARFPTLDTARRDPNWAAFVNEPLMTPAGAVTRQQALGMAQQTGNYDFIGQQLADFTARSNPSGETTMPASFGAIFPESQNAPASAVPYAQPRAGSGGGSAPPPSLAQVAQGTQLMSRARAEQKLQELSRMVDLNPRDRQALERYDALSHAMRTAHLEGRLV